MEEFDSHTEHAQEQAHEAAHEARQRWITGVALTAAILAALAAITSMISGHHEHEAMMLQMQVTDRWNEYQSKKIKTLLREERIENIELAGGTVPAKLKGKVADAQGEMSKLSDSSKGMERLARSHDDLHSMFAAAVTLFQVAIAVSAVSALTRRKAFWYTGMGLGIVALGFLSAGLLVSGGVVGSHPTAAHASAAD